MPLKEQLGAGHLSLEVLKTGRRMWVTVFMGPVKDTLQMDEFLALKTKLQDIFREVNPNTQTKLILERL